MRCDDGLHPADELGTEDQGVGLGQLEAVLDLVGRVAVVHGNGDGARLEDAEVDGQPLDAVHQQDGDLVALADAAREEQVGEPVGRLVELPPGDLPAGGLHGFGLHELVLAPGDLARLAQFGIELHETDLVPVQRSVTRDEIGDQHGGPPSRVRFRGVDYSSAAALSRISTSTSSTCWATGPMSAFGKNSPMRVGRMVVMKFLPFSA